MLTAKEARDLAGPTVEEKVEALLVKVKELAEQKERHLRTGWEYTENKDLWVDGGYSGTKEYKQACEILTKLGYKVSFYYNETQFVDMYTLITW